MMNEEQEKFYKELKRLTDEYGLKNVVFGCDKGGAMWGFYGMTPMKTMADVAEVIMVTARLYQGGREKLFNALDSVVK